MNRLDEEEYLAVMRFKEVTYGCTHKVEGLRISLEFSSEEGEKRYWEEARSGELKRKLDEVRKNVKE